MHIESLTSVHSLRNDKNDTKPWLVVEFGGSSFGKHHCYIQLHVSLKHQFTDSTSIFIAFWKMDAKYYDAQKSERSATNSATDGEQVTLYGN